MKFKEAFKEMKSGLAVKLPSWAGYWWWDEEAQTILMYTKGCEKRLERKEAVHPARHRDLLQSNRWRYRKLRT